MKNIKTYEEYTVGINILEFIDTIVDDSVDLSSITEFWCTESRINDLTGIEQLNINLIAFICENNRLTNLKGIERFTQLSNLNCGGNSLTDLKEILNLDIYCLDCFDNRLTSLQGLKNSKQLEMINCSYNSLSNLEDLENLTNIKNIECFNNKITSLKRIENLTKLTHLYCNDNPIDWVDYVDKQGRTYYTKLPKSLEYLSSDKFNTIRKYLEFMDKNQPAGVSRKFNF